MTKRDKSILIEGLRKLSQDAADIAAALEGAEAQAKKLDEPAPEPEPVKAGHFPRRSTPTRKSGRFWRRSPGRLSGGGQGAAAHRARRKAAV